MRAAAGIFVAALRGLVRTRTALLLAVLVMAANVLLPLGIRGDGSAEGALRMHMAYTLGMSVFLLGLFSLWAGSASVSGEAGDGTLTLVLTKPAGRWAVWAGKWMALMAVNGVLLAGGAALSRGVLEWRLRSWEKAGLHDAAELAAARAEVLGCRAEALAAVDDVGAEVEERYARLKAEGRVQEGVREGALKRQLRRDLLTRRYALEAGAGRTWRFEWPAGARREEAQVRWKCERSTAGGGETAVEWRMGGGEGVRAEFVAGLPQRLAWQGGEEAVVEGVNRDAEGAGLYFDPEVGVVLTAPAGRWAANMARILLLQWVRLGFLAAAGLTLGVVFSRGTAVFLSLALLLLQGMAGFVGTAAQTDREVFVENVAVFGRGGHGAEAEDVEPGALAKAAADGLYWIYRGTWTVLRPLLDNRSLEAAGTGTRVETGEVWRRVAATGVAWPAALCALSAWALRRREWGTAGGEE